MNFHPERKKRTPCAHKGQLLGPGAGTGVDACRRTMRAAKAAVTTMAGCLSAVLWACDTVAAIAAPDTPPATTAQRDHANVEQQLGVSQLPARTRGERKATHEKAESACG